MFDFEHLMSDFEFLIEDVIVEVQVVKYSFAHE